MKIKYNILFLLGLALTFGSCEIDNYEEPQSFFTGQITYEGEPIRVASDQVRFQLWQSGFGKEGPLDVHVAQDGSFSALLFDGDYRLDFMGGQGPFIANTVNEQQGDTLFIEINGDIQMDLEVTPYYMVRDPQFSLSGNTVQASVSLEQIITGQNAKGIEYVTLYLNTTQFVSSNSDENIASSDAEIVDEDLDNLQISVEIPDDITQDYVFARIGVKIDGVEDMIYSPIEKLEF